MNLEQITNYLPFVLLAGFLGWRYLKMSSARKKIPGLIANGAIIVDVRSPEEFQSAHNPKSINIPVSNIGTQTKQFDKKRPIILCCASGARSGVAAGALKQQGFENVINAGPWTNTL